jgi:hypothetical protein
MAHIPDGRCQVVNALHVDRDWRHPLEYDDSGFRLAQFADPIRVPVRPADVRARGRVCSDALQGMVSGRIGRGRHSRPSPLVDAFFIALAGLVTHSGKTPYLNPSICVGSKTTP